MKPFRSKILTYPMSIRDELDKMIGDNVSQSTMLNFLKNYKEKIGGNIPDPFTLERYVEFRKTGRIIPTVLKKPEPAPVVAVPEVVSLTNLAAVQDKKGLLENLIITCQSRLDIIMEMQQHRVDIRWEQTIKSYLEEIRQTVESLARLSGELKEDQTVVINIVQGEMTKVLMAVHQVLKEVCPDKIAIFKQKLRERGIGGD